MAPLLTGFTMFILGVTAFAAYITHLFWSITLLAASVSPTIGQIVLAILGCFVPPVGSIHGLTIWFGI